MAMKAIFFLHYRAGSSFFQHLTGHTPKFLRADLGMDPELEAPDYYYLTTLSKKVTAKHADCGSINKIAREMSGLSYSCILTHLGNWWGDLPSNSIPAPLIDPSPMKWSVAELRPYIYEGWKFVNIIRDGRNLIESLRNKKGGVEEEANKRDRKEYFKQLCLGFRNRARVALYTQEALGPSYYRIMKFEDLMDQPLQFMNDIYQFAFNLPANDDIIREKLSQIRKRKRVIHSSFGSTTNLNKRYAHWTEEERRTFKQIAGSEQQELKYDI